MGAISFQNVERLSYDKIYYHDYHGWRDTLTDYNEAFNAFTSDGNDQIESISFFTASDNVDYTIEIYDRFEKNNLLDLIGSVSDAIEYSGFHTIDLDEQLGFTDGDDFYIKLLLSDGGHPFDRTSEVPVLLGSTGPSVVVESTSEPGQSFYLDDSSEWIDLTTYDETANFCIKVLTNIWNPGNSDLECSGSLTFNDVKTGRNTKGVISIENIGDSFSSLSWNIIEFPDWGTWTFEKTSGNFLKPENGILDVEVTVRAPLERNQEFNGTIKVVNSNDLNDYGIIEVSLTAVKNKPKYTVGYDMFIERISNKFPILLELIKSFIV
jgi:hypothetical protein